MAGRHPRQQGAALLIFLILLVTAALTYVVTSLTPEAIEAKRSRNTQAALAQAREALLGYALKYRDEEALQGRMDRMYGYLPLPDLGTSRNQNTDPNCKDASNNPLEGCDANTPSGIAYDANGILPTIVGRLPWRTLGIAPLRDGSGECLWLIVSSLHGRKQRSSPPPVLPPLNWDTLGQLDIVVANGTAALNSTLASAHDRPLAIIFAPGPPLPGQDRSRSTTDDVTQCGGNYNAANYLDPFNATALGGMTNYLAGTNNASGITGDSDPSNDPDVPKGLLLNGKVFSAGGNYLPDTCQGSGCTLAANDFGQTVTGEMLFGAIRKSANFRTDINTMLDRMVSCLRDEIAASNPPTNPYARIAGADTHACYGQGSVPLGYYPHYKEMIFVAVPGGGANVTVDGVAQPNCAGALLFANQRGAGQQRVTLADKAAYGNYLEGGNLASFSASGNAFAGAGLLDRSMAGGQAKEQDIVRCIPAGASQKTVSLDLSARFQGATTLASYAPSTQTLTLGVDAVQLASADPDAGKLFGCSWASEPHVRGNGFRSYFRFKIRDTGAGFTFAIIDDIRNPNAFNRCGAASQHLGYSGNNGYTLPIEYPKIAIEFDTSRNANFTEAGNSLTNGRNDPNYTPPYDNDSHAAIMYWGYDTPNASAGVTQPGQDDNVHGFPLLPDLSSRPAPRNATATIPHPFPAPYPPLAIAPLDRMGSTTMLDRDFHVRVEATPLARSAEDETYKRRPWKIEAWIVPTYAKVITNITWAQDTNPNSGTATVTVPNHGFGTSGSTHNAMIREAPAGFNGDYAVTIIDANTFRFSKYPDPGSTVLTGQPVAMKLTDQVARMRLVTRSMAMLSTVVKYNNTCSSDADCASSQSCSGVEQDGHRYCYSGHQPTIYDRPTIYDIDLGGGAYHDALQSIRLGFTIGIGTNDQVIDISEFSTAWVP